MVYINIEVTDNIIIGSAIYNIKESFGTRYRYYDELIEEGFERPSFHVYRITGINRKGYTGNSYKMEDNSYRLLIKYFPEEKDNRMEDINNKIDELKKIFKYFNIINIVEEEGEEDVIYSKPNRVNEISYTTSEGVLLFEIQLDIRTVQYLEAIKVEANILDMNVE